LGAFVGITATLGAAASIPAMDSPEKLHTDAGITEPAPENSVDGSSIFTVANTSSAAAPVREEMSKKTTSTMSGTYSYEDAADAAKKKHKHYRPNQLPAEPKKKHPHQEQHPKHREPPSPFHPSPGQPPTQTPNTALTPTDQLNGIGGPAKIDLHPENLASALNNPEVLTQMKENAAYIPELGCSGWIIRNQDGMPIGVISALHCLIEHNKLIQGSDGQWTFNTDNPIRVFTGDNTGDSSTESTMTEIGIIDQVYTNLDTTSSGTAQLYTSDDAIFSMVGYDMQDVKDAVQSQFLTPDEISKLAEGSVVYQAGYPVDSSGSTDIVSRQDMALSVLGNSTTTLDDSKGNPLEQLNVLFSAVTIDQAGYVCSPGMSGSMQFIINAAGQVKFIGVFSGYNLWKAVPTAGVSSTAPANQQDSETFFNADLDQYAGYCVANTNQMVFSASDSQTIPVTYPASSPELPVDAFEDQFVDNFFNPDYPRQHIQGLVYVNAPGIKPFWASNLPYAYDLATDTLLLATYQQNSSENPADHLNVIVIQNASTTVDGEKVIQGLGIYGDGQSTPGLVTAMSATEPTSSSAVAFQTQDGTSLGDFSLPGNVPPTNAGEELIVNDSGLQINALPDGSIPVANPNPENPVPVGSGS